MIVKQINCFLTVLLMQKIAITITITIAVKIMNTKTATTPQWISSNKELKSMKKSPYRQIKRIKTF